MTPQRKLFLAGAILVILLVSGLAFLLLRPKQPSGGEAVSPQNQLGTESGGTGTGAIAGQAGSSGTVREPPTTISADLAVTPATEVDHRVKKPVQTGNPPPKLDFTYTLETKLPDVTVTSVPIIMFKDINTATAKQLATSYGLATTNPFIKGVTYSFTGDVETKGVILTVNGKSGYSSYSAVLLPPGTKEVTTAAAAVEVATARLKEIGLLPEQADTLTYKRKSIPGTFFVEVHRSWKPIPIIESRGMLYASLSDRTLNRPKDADVTATSDRSDGLARADDFNTVTVAVDAAGRIPSITANMRPVERVLPERAIKTPQQAWEDLQAGRGVLGFTVPADPTISGKTWEQAFPNNTASSKAARVREQLLAYAEKPDGERQRYLQPVYIFKGSAMLESGITTDFIVAVAALADDSLPQ